MKRALIAAMLLGSSLWVMPALASPYIYVPDTNQGSLTVVDAATNTIVRTISNLTYPYAYVTYDVVVGHDGSRAYIAEPLDGDVAILDRSKINDPNQDPIIDKLTGLVSPVALAVSPDNKFLFVSTGTKTGSGGEVLEINLATKAIRKEFDLPNAVYTLALDASGRLLAAGSSDSTGSTVRLYTLSTGAFTDIAVPGIPKQLVFSNGGGTLWVITDDGELLSYSLATGKQTVLASSGVAGAMAYSVRQHVLYVTSMNGMALYEYPAAGGSPSTISLPDYPSGIVLSPDGTRAYVTFSSLTQGINVIDTSTGQIVDNVTAGSTQRFILGDIIGSGDISGSGSVVASTVGRQISGTVTADDSLSRPLSYDVIQQPADGTLNFDQSTGAYTYTPPPGSSGIESFVWEAKAASGAGSPTVPASDPITTALVIAPALSAFNTQKANAGATIGPLEFTLKGSTPLNVEVTSSNKQVIDPASARISNGCGSGSLDCTLTLTAGNARGQTAKVTVTATDPGGASSSQTFTVSINGSSGGGGSTPRFFLVLLATLPFGIRLHRRGHE